MRLSEFQKKQIRKSAIYKTIIEDLIATEGDPQELAVLMNGGSNLTTPSTPTPPVLD